MAVTVPTMPANSWPGGAGHADPDGDAGEDDDEAGAGDQADMRKGQRGEARALIDRPRQRGKGPVEERLGNRQGDHQDDEQDEEHDRTDSRAAQGGGLGAHRCLRTMSAARMTPIGPAPLVTTSELTPLASMRASAVSKVSSGPIDSVGVPPSWRTKSAT